MNGRTSLMWRMVWKDFQLHRGQIAATMAIGAASLAVLPLKRESAAVVGVTALFTTLVVACSMLPASNILNERKKQNLPFLMSLPISFRQYTTAKLISTVGMFLTPWLTLAAAALLLILQQGIFPHGAIPLALVVLLLPLVGLCIITAGTLVGETEGWSIGATIACNSSYGLIWYFVTQTPSLMRELPGNRAVWSPAVVTLLASELGAIVAILALTYFLQSRKRAFV